MTAEPVKKARLHRRVLDHWKNFWLGIKTDYTEAMLDFKKDAQAKPVKSAILGAFAGFLLYCNQHNPDERSFHENFMENGLELSQVRTVFLFSLLIFLSSYFSSEK